MTPTTEQVAAWAREAGVKAGEHFEFRGGYEEMPVLEQREFDAVYRFATLVAAWQEEKDAELCDSLEYEFRSGANCAAAIRANAPKVAP